MVWKMKEENTYLASHYFFSFLSSHWNFSKQKKSSTFICKRIYMRISAGTDESQTLSMAFLDYRRIKNDTQLIMVLKKTNKKRKENALLTSCTQFVRIVIKKSDTVCTTNAQIIPIQSPCREKVLQILLMIENSQKRESFWENFILLEVKNY